jgi:predicted Zn-dependent peptidase
VLGGLASSRLDRILVRDEKIAVSVSANMQPFHRIGLMEITAVVKPGVDTARVEKRLDEEVAQYIAAGPTQDELNRAATQVVAGRIRGIERVASQNRELAEGLLYNGSSEFYRRSLEEYAAVTPAAVKAAMQQWLGRPVLAVRVEPGDRPPYEESNARVAKKGRDIKVPSVKRQIPPLGQPIALDFPDVAHVALSNGIKVAYAQRTAAPVTQVALSFDAGYAADAPGQRGLQNIGGVERALCTSSADQRVQLVYEDDVVRVLDQLAHDLL